MLVTNKADFDIAMLGASAGTNIQLPGGTINWELNVYNLCTIDGNGTTIDVSGLSKTEAVRVTVNAALSNFRAKNDTGDGVYIKGCAPDLSQVFAECVNAYKFENVNGGSFDQLDATTSEFGFKIINTRNASFNRCDAHNCTSVGFDLVGSSSAVGDIFFQELGLNVENSATLCGLTDATTYYFKINTIEYKLTTVASTTYAGLVNLLNAATRVVAGNAFNVDYLAVFANGDIRITNKNASAVALAAGTTGTNLFVSITGFAAFDAASTEIEANRTDRTHHNNFTSCFSFENPIGVRYTNSDNNAFDNCSKVYDNTNIGILQQSNSYSNKYEGEIFGNASFGIKNTDAAGGTHDFDATGAWWGAITGPSSIGPGTGDRVTSHVIYQPWGRSGTEPELTYPVTRNWMWSMLGSPLVRVELTEEQFTQDIETAIERYMYYWDPEPYYHYFDIGLGQQEIMLPVEIPKERVMEVVYQPYADIFAALSGSGQSFFLTYYLQKSGGVFLADFYIAMAYKETFERVLGIHPTYEYLTHPQDNTQPYNPTTNPYRHFIRIYPRPSGMDMMRVAIKVSRVLTEEEVDNEFWIRKYALTFAKEQLGRVRGKFGSVPGPSGEIQLNAAELIAEASQEREALIRDLISRSEPLGFTLG